MSDDIPQAVVFPGLAGVQPRAWFTSSATVEGPGRSLRAAEPNSPLLREFPHGHRAAAGRAECQADQTLTAAARDESVQLIFYMVNLL